MNKDVKEIMVIAEEVYINDKQKMAFEESFEQVFAPFFLSITGKNYDATIAHMYQVKWKTLIANAKEIYSEYYKELEKQGIRTINMDQIGKDIQLVEYSERAFALVGKTQRIKDKFKVDGSFIGRFNRALWINGVKRPGWIFPLKHRDYIERVLRDNEETNNSNPFMVKEDATNETETLF